MVVVLVYFSSAFIMAFALLNCVELFTNIKFKEQDYFILLGLFSLLLAFLTAQINPPKAWDLFAHYSEINVIRLRGLEYAFTDSHYHSFPVITLLFYVVSLLNSNKWLVFITLFIEYSVYIYCLRKNTLKYKSSSGRSLCFFVFFAFINIVLAISGIRNVLAFSIASVAIIREFLLEDGKISNCCLLALSILIHPSGIYFLLLYAVIKFVNNTKITYAVMIVSPFISSVVGKWFASSSNQFLQAIGSTFGVYNTGNHILIYDWRMLIFNCICLIILLIAIVNLQKSDKDVPKLPTKYIKFLKAYLILALTSLYIPLIFNRLLYGLAYLLIPVIICNFRRRSFRYCQYFLIFYCVITIAYQFIELYHVVFV